MSTWYLASMFSLRVIQIEADVVKGSSRKSDILVCQDPNDNNRIIKLQRKTSQGEWSQSQADTINVIRSRAEKALNQARETLQKINALEHQSALKLNPFKFDKIRPDGTTDVPII